MTLESESNNRVSVRKNCGNSVSQKNYCTSYGQKSDTHILSFRELLHELADGLSTLTREYGDPSSPWHFNLAN